MANRESERHKLVAVLMTTQPGEVSMARDILDQAGIDAFVFDEHFGKMIFLGGAAIPPRLMVLAKDVERALEVLKDFGFEPDDAE
ncbi:MAG: DUF2007 domain-containing protein [Candidatus Binataceae bacterium]